MNSTRTARVIIGVPVVVAILAWFLAASGIWAPYLAVHGALPDALSPLASMRGWMPWLRVSVGLFAAMLSTVMAGVIARPSVGAAMGIVATVAWVVLTFPGGGQIDSAREAFALYGPALERVAELPVGSTGWGHREELPLELRSASVNGTITRPDGMIFVPQWTHIVDDAGGFFYSPGRSPEGEDMYGMFCVDPVRMDGGWWACGMLP